MAYEYGKRFFVITRSKGEFEAYRRKAIQLCQENRQPYKIMDFVHVISVNRLKGHRNINGVFYGNWKNHPEIEQIIIELMMMNKLDDKDIPKIIKEFYYKEFVENVK